MKIILLLTVFLAGCPPIPTAHAVEVDKDRHLAAGIILGTVDWKLGCGAGLAKEVHDSTGAGTVEFADFAYTCAGAGLTHVIGQNKSWLYRANVSLILLDGTSTSHFVHHTDRVESGPISVSFLGEKPSDARIAVYTVMRLGMLEWSDSWPYPFKQGFQWGSLLITPRVIMINYSF